MDTPRTIKWFLSIGWFVLLVLLLTACATRDVPAAASDQVIYIPLGTTLLTTQSTTSVFTVAWSPKDRDLVVSLRTQDWAIKIDYANGTGDGHVVW